MSSPDPTGTALTGTALTGIALTEADDDEPTADPPPEVHPLLTPRDGPVDPIVGRAELERLAGRLAAVANPGPIALDAERASGFRYSARAYLVQLRRADTGSALIDPIPLGGDLSVLAEPLARSEWVLHAATQDLACLAEIGLRPKRLFDTELAGRLAGFDRVGLASLVERMLGLGLVKGHGAADWSQRPLPAAWLNYAALDVEVLLELRDAMAEELERQGKTEWAAQEFAALVDFTGPTPRAEPWRRTSGIHRMRDARKLAIVRELWTARDTYAEQRDIAPHRVLPDAAIVQAATAQPKAVAALVALPLFAGRGQRRQAARWQAAIDAALALPPADLPSARGAAESIPPVQRWREKNPSAATRLTAARAALAELSEELKVPVENLISPELVRRVCWPEPGADVRQQLRDGGARPWQVELVGGLLAEIVVS